MDKNVENLYGFSRTLGWMKDVRFSYNTGNKSVCGFIVHAIITDQKTFGEYFKSFKRHGHFVMDTVIREFFSCPLMHCTFFLPQNNVQNPQEAELS